MPQNVENFLDQSGFNPADFESGAFLRHVRR